MDEQALLERIDRNHKHHPPSSQQRADKHEFVREITADCAKSLVETCPVSRELYLALSKMEEAMMWANAAIAREENEDGE